MSSLANSLAPRQSLLDSDSERGSPKWALHLPTAKNQPGLSQASSSAQGRGLWLLAPCEIALYR